MRPPESRKEAVSRNICVLFGSPRKNGNTQLLVGAFVRGAEHAGHAVTVCNTASAHIQGCKACNACWSKGKPCIYDDGFNDLAPYFEHADTLVLASPLYWFGFSSQIKTAVDKFYAYIQPASPLSLRDRSSVLLMAAESHTMNGYEGARATYRLMCEYMRWQQLGEVTALNVNHKGDILKTGYLEKAEALGASLK